MKKPTANDLVLLAAARSLGIINLQALIRDAETRGSSATRVLANRLNVKGSPTDVIETAKDLVSRVAEW